MSQPPVDSDTTPSAPAPVVALLPPINSEKFEQRVQARFGVLPYDHGESIARRDAHGALAGALAGRLHSFSHRAWGELQTKGAHKVREQQTHDLTRHGTLRPDELTLSFWLDQAHGDQATAPLNLIHFYFSHDHLKSQPFNAHLSFSLLEDQLWDQVNASGSVLFGTQFTGGHFEQCNFSHCNLQAARFQGIEFRHGTFEGSRFKDALLFDCTLDRVNLAGADFSHASFNRVKLMNIDLTKASDSLRQAITTQRGIMVDSSCTIPPDLRYTLEAENRLMTDGKIPDRPQLTAPLPTVVTKGEVARITPTDRGRRAAASATPSPDAKTMAERIKAADPDGTKITPLHR